jgi:excisionase family DNA binding protein
VSAAVPPSLVGKLTITVPEAGEYYGLSRDAAYRAAAAGEIPSLKIGRRVVVPVVKMLEQLGIHADA